MWRTILIFAAILLAATVALRWIEFQLLARTHPGELYIGLLAALFMGLGVWAGSRLFPRKADGEEFVANAKAREALGISEREFEVLELLAAGESNKGIAGRLNVSPNTVKTHIARLFEKLDVSRRTEAILRARELGMLK
jgi:DNA-binding CsgD family transcriptional regulator